MTLKLCQERPTAFHFQLYLQINQQFPDESFRTSTRKQYPCIQSARCSDLLLVLLINWFQTLLIMILLIWAKKNHQRSAFCYIQKCVKLQKSQFNFKNFIFTENVLRSYKVFHLDLSTHRDLENRSQ